VPVAGLGRHRRGEEPGRSAPIGSPRRARQGRAAVRRSPLRSPGARRVGERGRHDGSPGRDRIDQDTGRHLVAGVVGEHHHVGGLRSARSSDARSRYLSSNDHVAERRRPGPLDEHVAIPPRRALAHLRMRRSRDDVLGDGHRDHRARSSASIAHSIPLPGPSRPQVSTRGGLAGPARRRPVSRPLVVAPCGITEIFVRVDVEAGESRVLGRLGHDHDRVGGIAHRARARIAGSESARSGRCGPPPRSARRSPTRSRRSTRRRHRRTGRTRVGR
jgi:hypothetical protein